MIWEGRMKLWKKRKEYIYIYIYQFTLYKRHGKLQELKDETAYKWIFEDRKLKMKKEVSDFWHWFGEPITSY